LLALYLVSGAVGCTPQSAREVSPAKAASSQANSSEARTGPIKPGFELGFTHCCGDYDYVMQVDCGEQLLRCYANESSGWKQTYGRNCKNALGAGCYERGCLDVCE
jgi:hypothetical protein